MIAVKEISSHRNGICGEPFVVVLFDYRDSDAKLIRRMHAVVFDAPGHVAVFDRDMTADGNIAFGEGNSWRGDHFEPDLRAAIRKHYEPAWEREAQAALLGREV